MRYTVGKAFDVAMTRCYKGGATVIYVLARRREMRKNSYVKNEKPPKNFWGGG